MRGISKNLGHIFSLVILIALAVNLVTFSSAASLLLTAEENSHDKLSNNNSQDSNETLRSFFNWEYEDQEQEQEHDQNEEQILAQVDLENYPEVNRKWTSNSSWSEITRSLATLLKESVQGGLNRQMSSDPFSQLLNIPNALTGGLIPQNPLNNPSGWCDIKLAVCVTIIYGARKCCLGAICPIFKLFKCEVNQRRKKFDENEDEAQKYFGNNSTGFVSSGARSLKLALTTFPYVH